MKNGMLSISTGAGFLPSTVSTKVLTVLNSRTGNDVSYQDLQRLGESWIPSSSPTDLSEKGVLLGSNPLAHCWLMIGLGLF